MANQQQPALSQQQTPLAQDLAMPPMSAMYQAPVFAPRNEAIDYVSQVDLDEIFDDCFMTNDWLLLGEELAASPYPEPPLELVAPAVTQEPSRLSSPAVKPNEAVKQEAQLDQPHPEQPEHTTAESADSYDAEQRRQVRSTRNVARRYYGEDEDFEQGDDFASEDSAATKQARGRGAVNGGNSSNATRKRRRPVETKLLTDEQRVERRERNREHAKRSRIRKKFLLESLLEQVQELRGENKELRDAIREHVPDEAHHILSSCSTEESLLLCAEPSSSPIGKTQQLMEPDFRLMMALQSAQQNFAVSDPSLADNPIVYASQGFLNLTGYTMSQVIGRNCRFLQGPGTDPNAVAVIREGVKQGIDTSVCLLNYKADGTPFWNQFFVAALRDADGQIVNYVGVQCQVNQVPIEEIKERAKRMALLDI